MPNLTRKTLIIRPDIKPCLPLLHDCDTPPPPPPPPPHRHPLPPLTVIMLCTLATTVSFLCYIAIIKACHTFQKRSRIRTRTRTDGNIINNTNETHRDFIDQDHSSVVFHPIWLINTIGVDQSVIDSIGVLKYKKGNGLFTDSDCAVCLGEFEEDESLRILPECKHAFHVNCIDTWLHSHKNCPVCRTLVMKNNNIESNSIESNAQEEIPIGDSGNESENTREIERNNKCLFGIRVQSDLIDHRRRCHERESESEPERIRRSVSMIQLAAGNQGRPLAR